MAKKKRPDLYQEAVQSADLDDPRSKAAVAAIKERQKEDAALRSQKKK